MLIFIFTMCKNGVLIENGQSIYRNIGNLLESNAIYELILKELVDVHYPDLIKLGTPEDILLEVYKNLEMETEAFVFTAADEIDNLILRLFSSYEVLTEFYYVKII